MLRYPVACTGCELAYAGLICGMSTDATGLSQIFCTTMV
jgi:hypothetical protein